ncbi:unnamed protein product [Allacma fusca]|uniref:C2H2-type domain-containing protein n=1 Tax=Allacma fusca TaxID=39272 RepID=A0A8J2PBZ3_9HEXA|nr:unnamed protein product [Allacma fusca]
MGEAEKGKSGIRNVVPVDIQCTSCVTKWRDQDPSIEDELVKINILFAPWTYVRFVALRSRILTWSAEVDVVPVVVDRNPMIPPTESSRQTPVHLGQPVRPGQMTVETVWTYGTGNATGQMVFDDEGEAAWLNAPLVLVLPGQQLPPFNAYTCDICGRSFNTTGHKSQHRETHFRRTPCQFWGSPIDSRQARRRHVRIFHAY